MSTEHNFHLYTKDIGGNVVRTHRVVQIDDTDLQDYTHHEKLLGWPEKIVYWRIMGDDSCVGISPASDAAFRSVLALKTVEVR